MAADTPDAFAVYESEGGTRVKVVDDSAPYGYANLFRAALRVEARFPGQDEPYERTLQRLGVMGAELGRVRAELLHNFERSSLPYLLRPDFAEKFQRQLQRAKRKVIWFPGNQP